MKAGRFLAHSYDARNNTKLKVLRKILGFEGYGRFWALVEVLYDSNGVFMVDKPIFKQVLADELEMTVAELDEFLSVCAECDLIDAGLLSVGHVASKTVCEQLEYDKAKAESGKKGAETRWKKGK